MRVLYRSDQCRPQLHRNIVDSQVGFHAPPMSAVRRMPWIGNTPGTIGVHVKQAAEGKGDAGVNQVWDRLTADESRIDQCLDQDVEVNRQALEIGPHAGIGKGVLAVMAGRTGSLVAGAGCRYR